MSASHAARRPSLLQRAAAIILHWIDSDHSPERQAEMRTQPDRVDWGRCLPFIILHLACLGVIWVGWSPFAVWTAVGLYFVRMFAVTSSPVTPSPRVAPSTRRPFS